MGIIKAAKKAFKKAVDKALSGVTDGNSPRAAAPEAAMGPVGDTGTRATATDAMRRRSRRSRGRDSTIITARSEIGSRTLLG